MFPSFSSFYFCFPLVIFYCNLDILDSHVLFNYDIIARLFYSRPWAIRCLSTATRFLLVTDPLL